MAEGSNPTIGLGVAGCGALLALMTGGVGLFSAFHVFIDPKGKISRDEAMPFFASGCCCSLISFVIVAAGVFLYMRAKSAAAQGTPPAPPAPK